MTIPALSPNLVAGLYLVSGVLFILALRGLSSPATSRRGNYAGMLGMAIAMGTTLAIARPELPVTWMLIGGGLAVGGLIGAVTARRIPMTAMPELVAAFHSLVGLAAVFVAASALYAPDSFGIGSIGDIHFASLIEMSLGVAIGAITFTGSVIAFAKLSGRMSGKPITLPGRHVINLALFGLLVWLIYTFCLSGGDPLLFWAITLTAMLFGILIIIPIGGADMPVVDIDAQLVFGLGGGRHRLHAVQHRAHHHRRARRLLGRHPVLHHVQGHEPLVHLGDPRRLRRRGCGPGGRRLSRSRSSSARPRTPPT